MGNRSDGTPRGMPELIGRGQHFDAIWRAYRMAADGRATVVALAGEPGIGKTHLLAALAAHGAADGAIVLRGSASEAAGMPPYLPFLEALGGYIRATPPERLRAQAGELAPVLATILPELPTRIGALAPGYPLPAEQARLRLYEAIGFFLAAAAEGSPLILILDDLHWVDAASLDLLAHLIRVQPTIRLLLAGAYRPGEATENPALTRALAELSRLRALTIVEITPLDRSALADLASARLAAPLAPDVLAALHQKSEGNPFFAEELLRDWRESGAIIETGAIWRATPGLAASLPATIAAVVHQRLSRLDPATGALLQTAAIIGRRFDAPFLSQVAGLGDEQTEDLLQGGVRARLLGVDGDGTYAFGHDTVRECLYGDVTPVRRRRLHGFIGRAIEARGAAHTSRQLAELAFHFKNSGDRARGARYSRLAGDQAAATYAFVEATVHYREALDLLDADVAERGPVLLSLGEAASLANAEADAVAAFEESETIFLRDHDPVAAARGARGAGRSAWRQELTAQARTAFERGLAHLDGRDSREAVEIMVDLAGLLGVSQQRQQEGVVVGRRALTLAQRLGERSLETAARRALGDVLIRGNDFAAGLPLLEAALSAAIEEDDPAIAAECCSALFHAFYWLGDLRRAWAMLDQRLTFARRSNDLHQLRHVYAWQTMQLAHQGRWAEAAATLDTAQLLVERLPNPEAQGFLQVVRGTLAWLQGDYETAETYARRVVGIFRTLGPGALLWYLAPLGILQIKRGKIEEALATFAEVEGLLAAQQSGTVQAADALSWLGAGAVLLRDRERAARSFGQLLPFAGRHTDFLVDRVLGELATVLGDWPAGEGYLAAAEAQARAGGDRIELPNVLAAQGRLAGARGGPGAVARARDLLDAALAHYDELGMAGEAARVRAELRQFAIPPAARPRPALPGGLSAREAEVLRLVATGRSNRAIAAELSLSERTIGNHLTNIFNKLGIDNRAAATAFALRNDLA
ncbi:MAG: hypothetical protein AVDCRST_MAG18-4080 [uncultured Thermomicrobiales bacterium]|uniref:HTH luxR-type domain-containing protein n=1 Tax=uncultured Thermomicrobiales bacterium TaxID=1645740 RepID=A0A6J4VSZ1_9BACT|nr:MAG: hypothetical protein AVDCRST_MAG18-4080 [uncultured Thermomicrobiales bacterium]